MNTLGSGIVTEVRYNIGVDSKRHDCPGIATSLEGGVKSSSSRALHWSRLSLFPHNHRNPRQLFRPSKRVYIIKITNGAKPKWAGTARSRRHNQKRQRKS